jgi:hypothetical protein
VPDTPPCLDTWQPVADMQPVPITAPTLFEVDHVRDDLDAYPRLGNDGVVGETKFSWSIQVDEGPRQKLANPLSSLALDPQAYAPGTKIQLRVEIADRHDIPINCDDTDPTCSVISQPSCIQRQTWLVEAR